MTLKAWAGDARGATAVEYGVLAACLALAIIGALGMLEERLYNLLVSVATTVSDSLT